MAFDHDPDLDGNMTLDETKSTCEREQDRGFQLKFIHFGTKIVNGTTLMVNKTGFNEQLTGILTTLKFVEIKGTDNPDKVKGKHEEEGWTFICREDIFERKIVKNVMVFGRKE